MSIIDIDALIENLRCEYGEKHKNSPILEIDLKKQEGIEKKNRLLCGFCIYNFQGGVRESMGVSHVIQAIKEQYKNIEEYRFEQITSEKKLLEKIKLNLVDFQTQLYQILNETGNLIDQCNCELDNLSSNIQFNIMDEIDEVAQQYIRIKENKYNQNNLIFEEFHKTLTKIRIAYQIKFKNEMKKVEESISNIVHQFTQYNNRDQERENQLIENNIQRISRIKIIRDRPLQHNKISEIYCQYCVALSFDYECKFLAISTQENNVHIYNVENKKLEENIQKLNHENQVYSIIFSKNQNWLVTGISTGGVIIWKFQDSRWEKYVELNVHRKTVFGLLLNQNEDLLFSCSEDESIIIWNLNFAQNVVYKQEKINTNSGSIFSLTLNKSEDRLACCSRLTCVIIWEYSKEQAQWNYKQNIMISQFDFGYRISFYNNYLIFQPSNVGICIVYEEKDNIFQEFQQLQLNCSEPSDKVGLSPIQYNETKNIMILKHSQFVYFIRQQADKNFKIIGDSIQNKNNIHFSALSQNGEYLAWWNQDNKIVLFKLDYE
ncbi:unnamed protein product (macronuclear) [Paramecium tetraurelia]|uniref:Uncharacterized protein n=1 Tax=Paramecium tetraurelia TaxID=5888 RepID=A0D4Y3_PARTE|nr:uncharacterized protein GSPATT00013547001 [Paramecium tetraurelia]CAK78100.1 unnamed protein product [Paramecium tetraurelia]|eukprot:XP_001445497.1 hypothetical protein (macronuclear) [Paramecium tetraurelia strain d4-2]